MSKSYEAFLASKHVAAQERGMKNIPALASHLFPFQRHCVEFALRCGSSGLFLDTGLGKTACELEWSQHAAEASNGRALILTPLAVARQIEKEGLRWGYNIRVIREQADASDGINVCNYDRLEKLDTDYFGAVVLDESSIIKNFSGKTTMALIQTFANHQWRLAATATPAPNDHTELGNHAEFLGVMPMNDMLIRWFINDSSDTGTWRLKGHARQSFWEWMASWCRMAEHPRDLGDTIGGFDLPPLKVIRHHAESSDIKADAGMLYAIHDVSATKIHELKRQTADSRARTVAHVLNGYAEPFVVWVDTDYEADAVMGTLVPMFGARVAEIRGSMNIDAKEDAIARFGDGRLQGLVTKSKITGFGLNWQHCHFTVFAGQSFSYESWYQAIRRFLRFGQKHPVEVHLVVAEGEDSIGRVIDRKSDDHIEMKREMSQAMRRAIVRESTTKKAYEAKHSGRLPKWVNAKKAIQCIGEQHGERYGLYHGDCVHLTRQMPDESIDLSIYSPPFSNLFVYSDSIADVGNCANDSEFFEHYGYVIRELFRLTLPGRLSAVHCSDLPLTKWKDGMIGIKDLSGGVIREHEAAGWVLHSRITIWKSPVVEMTRTKALGLLHKQLLKDSGRSRAGMPDYLLVFRKPGDNPKPITHSREEFPVEQWQEWASPVWMTVDQTDVLNVAVVRSDKDEKHLCPLQHDVIKRAITLWSNQDDTVFSPFMGIGSEGVNALKSGRRFIGVELKQEYFRQACALVDAVDRQRVLL